MHAFGLMTRALVVALALAAAAAAPLAAQAPLPDTLPLPNGFAPEGIAAGTGTTLYAGSLSGQGIYALDVIKGEGGTLVEGSADQPYTGMKFERRTNRLFVAGAATGRGFVFDAATGAQLAAFQFADPGASFINDVIVTNDGAFFTDSSNARLFVLPLGADGALPEADAFATLPLTGDWAQVEGFNANGIAATRNGKWLIVVNSTTGLLYRVDPATGEAAEIDQGGETVTMGDGILLTGRTLYVVRNRANEVVELRVPADLSSATVVRTITNDDLNDALRVPTTLAQLGRSLYAVNARFGTTAGPEVDYDVARIDK